MLAIGRVGIEMDILARACKCGQEKLSDSLERIEALEFLKDAGIITQHDYWILTGNYRIVDC